MKIIANCIDPEETRVAIVEEGKLADLFVERMWERQRTGEIYKARVESVLPGIHAAFVNLGDGRNAFLYLNDAKGLDLKPNNELLVQVTKTARKNKGARVTSRISLPGRYIVLVPGGNESGVSKRIVEEGERKRLKAIARELRGDFGIIVRTAAEGVDAESLAHDVEVQLALWREIEHAGGTQNAPCLLFKDLGLLGRILRDELNEQVSEIIVDGEEEYENVRSYLPGLCGGDPPDLSLYRGAVPLFEYYGVEKEIEASLERKVWLDSGAYLVIDHTEALTVIDVNTGKYVGKTDLRHTVLDANLEAASEIARQLRLRAIGGIVVIDFIDMDFEEDRSRLLRRLEEVFQADRYRARVFGVSQLGLVEITRKRARPDIRSTLTRSCPECGGVGWVFREDTIAMTIKRFLRKVSIANRSEAILLETNATVARHVFETYLPMWENELGLRLFIAAVPEYPWSKFRLDCQGALSRVERRIELMETREARIVVYRTSST
ncbi:MAG: Rne/Rng family ribonuclease [Synergistaceae bacterium]|nr:Rne/Rng family ribonuclease [Synergistota bacterium]NLM71693.1 Rne/Rng family ribonuclease [Synergistaceae bacterium]